MRKTPSSPSDVLAGDEGQQLGGTRGASGERLAVEGVEGGQGVMHQGVDQGVAGSLVVPVTRWLAHGVVLVVAEEGGSDILSQGTARLVEHDEQLADGGA